MYQIFFSALFFLTTFSVFADPPPSHVMTMDEAIMLAIRKNPNVLQAKLNDVRQKYALFLAEWEFKPHYTLSAKTTTMRNFSVTDDGYVTENSTGVDGAVTLLTPYGTKGTLASSVNQTAHFHPSLSLDVIQPLIRGFGKPIVETALFNAKDNRKVSLLNIENTLRNTVTAVINAYLDVISAEKSLKVDEDALERAELSATQTKLFIKSGRKAGVELVAVDADIARAKTNIENDENTLRETRFALLNAIGLDPNSNITFSSIDISWLMKKYHVPMLNDAKILAIDNDIQYQIDQLTFHGALQRNLQEAKDNTRPQLDLIGNLSTGTSNDDNNSGLKSLVNGINQTSSLTLSLAVPVDDQVAKMALQSAKIAIQEAKIALQQEKWNKETITINSWNSIASAKRASLLAEEAKQLQEQAYQISFQKYSHGLIDSLQLQSALQQLKLSAEALNQASMNYVKALVNFDLLIGNTLKTWDIEVKKRE